MINSLSLAPSTMSVTAPALLPPAFSLAPFARPVHIVLHQGRIIAVDGGRGVIRARQNGILVYCGLVGGVVLHAVHTY